LDEHWRIITKDKKLSEIIKFLETEHSLVECAKRYKQDMNFLLDFIFKQHLIIDKLEQKLPPSVVLAQYDSTHREKLLAQIIDLVFEYQNTPIPCSTSL
jgi:hypothetical protein